MRLPKSGHEYLEGALVAFLLFAGMIGAAFMLAWLVNLLVE